MSKYKNLERKVDWLRTEINQERVANARDLRATREKANAREKKLRTRLYEQDQIIDLILQHLGLKKEYIQAHVRLSRQPALVAQVLSALGTKPPRKPASKKAKK